MDIAADRPPMNLTEYLQIYGSEKEKKTKWKNAQNVAKKVGKRGVRPCSSAENIWTTITSFMPILTWLPKYNLKRDFLSDLIGGVTTGVMHVPQGIAYSSLAGVKPVYGLYSSCFPDFFYMLFGTSKHASIVVALLAGVANTQVQDYYRIDLGPLYTPIQIASSLTFAIGILQFLCGFLHLQFLTSYLSDSLVSGFTTGAAAHVLLEQIDDLLGIKVPKYSGPGYIFRRLYAIIVRVPNSKPITCIISAIALAFLYVGKEYLTPFLKKKANLKFPIPFELILMAIASAVSYVLKLNAEYNVSIVESIPVGYVFEVPLNSLSIPIPALPIMELLPACITASIPIMVVATAVHISMAKMLAKKFNHKIDPQQELYALGLTSMLGGLFPVYPVSTALGRTMVNVSSGTKTQLSTVFSCLLLLTLIMWLGPLIEPLPMLKKDRPQCILAAIITIALKGMFMRCDEVKELYRVSKIDTDTWLKREEFESGCAERQKSERLKDINCMIKYHGAWPFSFYTVFVQLLWFFAFLSTLCIDVIWGLALSIAFALATLVVRTQWPRWQKTIDASSSLSNVQLNSDTTVCIHRFDAPLIFANVERFQKTVQKTLDEWNAVPTRIDDENAETKKKLFIFDFSAISYVDHMGVKILQEIATDLKKANIATYFAAINSFVLPRFLKGNLIPNIVPLENCFPTLRDALSLLLDYGLKRETAISDDENSDTPSEIITRY